MPIERLKGGPFNGERREVENEPTEEWILLATTDATDPDCNTALYHLESDAEGKVYVFKGWADQRR